MEILIYRASDLMKEPITIEKNAKIGEAIARILNEGIGALIVVDNNRPIGIVTKRDLLWALIHRKNALNDPVETVMSKQLVTINPDTELNDIVSAMIRNNISHLPVVDNDKIVGIISDRDLVEALNDLLNMFKAEEIRSSTE